MPTVSEAKEPDERHDVSLLLFTGKGKRTFTRGRIKGGGQRTPVPPST